LPKPPPASAQFSAQRRSANNVRTTTPNNNNRPSYDTGLKRRKRTTARRDGAAATQPYALVAPPNDPLGLKSGIVVTDGASLRLFPPLEAPARTVQSNLPIRPYNSKMGFSYFEVVIIDVSPPSQGGAPRPTNDNKQQQYQSPAALAHAKRQKTTIAIGLAANGYPMDRLPGWHLHSVAYASDGTKHTHASHAAHIHHTGSGNNNSTSGGGHQLLTSAFLAGGLPYGTSFGAGDVIGCGLNLNTAGCFFTLNGRYIGEAFYDLAHPAYHATIGADGPCDLVAIFGEGPFAWGPANPVIPFPIRGSMSTRGDGEYDDQGDEVSMTNMERTSGAGDLDDNIANGTPVYPYGDDVDMVSQYGSDGYMSQGRHQSHHQHQYQNIVAATIVPPSVALASGHQALQRLPSAITLQSTESSHRSVASSNGAPSALASLTNIFSVFSTAVPNNGNGNAESLNDRRSNEYPASYAGSVAPSSVPSTASYLSFSWASQAAAAMQANFPSQMLPPQIQQSLPTHQLQTSVPQQANPATGPQGLSLAGIPALLRRRLSDSGSYRPSTATDSDHDLTSYSEESAALMKTRTSSASSNPPIFASPTSLSVTHVGYSSTTTTNTNLTINNEPAPFISDGITMSTSPIMTELPIDPLVASTVLPNTLIPPIIMTTPINATSTSSEFPSISSPHSSTPTSKNASGCENVNTRRTRSVSIASSRSSAMGLPTKPNITTMNSNPSSPIPPIPTTTVPNSSLINLQQNQQQQQQQQPLQVSKNGSSDTGVGGYEDDDERTCPGIGNNSVGTDENGLEILTPRMILSREIEKSNEFPFPMTMMKNGDAELEKLLGGGGVRVVVPGACSSGNKK
ncbi:Rsp5p-dependent ubiquitination, sorting of cargo proteins at the multivesicular body, partial [Blyttiomyces sp. JEL0837]